MNNAYMSAIAALAGSAVGAFASFLCASANVIVKSEEAMHLIFETYNRPNIDFRNLENRQERDTDVLRAFSEACRENLRV
jgi:c-di-GMP-binding flagellar brake protein YcgR